MVCFTASQTTSVLLQFFYIKNVAIFNLLRIFYVRTPQPYNVHATLWQILPLLAQFIRQF